MKHDQYVCCLLALGWVKEALGSKKRKLSYTHYSCMAHKSWI